MLAHCLMPDARDAPWQAALIEAATDSLKLATR